VKFGARLPVRSCNSGVQHGLFIALALVRDELDALDAAAVLLQPEPPKGANCRHSPANGAAGNKIATPLDLQALSGDAYIRQARLLGDVLPVSRSTLWRWVNAGTFPAPVKLSAGMTAWRVQDVRDWLQNHQRLGGH
jgi:predicted DNA-binding transcriptional regulator AlpA